MHIKTGDWDTLWEVLRATTKSDVYDGDDLVPCPEWKAYIESFSTVSEALDAVSRQKYIPDLDVTYPEDAPFYNGVVEYSSHSALVDTRQLSTWTARNWLWSLVLHSKYGPSYGMHFLPYDQSARPTKAQVLTALRTLVQRYEESPQG